MRIGWISEVCIFVLPYKGFLFAFNFDKCRALYAQSNVK